jgi:hypothetical protein
MESAVAVHPKGFWSSFHAARKSSIAAITSSTLRNESRRIRLLGEPALNGLNQLQLAGT